MALACDNCHTIVHQTMPSKRWLRVQAFAPTDIESTTYGDLAQMVEGVFCGVDCLRAHLAGDAVKTRRLTAPEAPDAHP